MKPYFYQDEFQNANINNKISMFGGGKYYIILNFVLITLNIDDLVYQNDGYVPKLADDDLEPTPGKKRVKIIDIKTP